MNLHNYVYHNIFNDTAKNKKIGKNVIDTDKESQNVDDNESFVLQEIQWYQIKGEDKSSITSHNKITAPYHTI